MLGVDPCGLPATDDARNFVAGREATNHVTEMLQMYAIGIGSFLLAPIGPIPLGSM